ncbi:MAG: 4Fe-4S dicluster domain-containing protein [Chloroflexota bacterium]
MFAWIWRGLRTGIVTTRYPREPEIMPAAYRGRVVLDPDRCDPRACRACADVCLPKAITVDREAVRLDIGRCITCGFCLGACPTGAFTMRNDFELAARRREDLITEVRRVDRNGYVQTGGG